MVDSEAGAMRAIEDFGLPVAIKADGLAAGKGVHVAFSPGDVDHALDQLFRTRSVGAASDRVLIEEFLAGEELSVLVFTDGERLAIMPPARDYKRLLDGDRGPNTGGMGGFTWPSYATPELLDEVERTILRPTLDGMAAEGTPYRGVLYARADAHRLGPESDRIQLSLWRSGGTAHLAAPGFESARHLPCHRAVGRPDAGALAPGRTYGVVLASAGYPEAPRLGDRIRAWTSVATGFRCSCRHARSITAVWRPGRQSATLVSASREAVYQAAEGVQFAGKQYRNDIAAEAAVVSR